LRRGLGGIVRWMIVGMSDDAWSALADPFVDGAYVTVKGQVRTYVLHQQLLEQLPPPPAPVLDVGGGGVINHFH